MSKIMWFTVLKKFGYQIFIIGKATETTFIIFRYPT